MSDARSLPSLRSIHLAYYAAVFLRWFAVALPLALMVLLLQARGMSLFQVGLIMGIANDRSLAWGIARTAHAHGADVLTCDAHFAKLPSVRRFAKSQAR